MKVLNIVKNRLGETVGYDVKDIETGKIFENVKIDKIWGCKLINGSFINGKYPYIRGNTKLSTRIIEESITIYHGSDHIVENPEYKKGKIKNDYGQGFYTTMVKERAEEWALLMGDTPFCNSYTLNLRGLNIIDLDEYGPLAWIAEVLKNRGLGKREENYDDTINVFCNRYCVNLEKVDIIIGYRADDSYFRIIDSFISNQITIPEVINLFYKAKLGRQIFLKSKKSFNKEHLEFIKGEKVSKEKLKYAQKNDKNARDIVISFLKQRISDINFGKIKLDKYTYTDCLINFYKYDRERKVYYV